jgi:hypothetical protein
MRRRPKTRHSVEPSLFPFLAVLICMMGALVVLLVLVVQQARVHASVGDQENPEPKPLPKAPTELEADAEHAKWRADVLREQRDEVLSQVGGKQAALSHLESHIRELEDRSRQIQTELAALRNKDALQAELLEKREELMQLIEQNELRKNDLQNKRNKNSERPAFAILPFDKGNGTSRRPIYLECVEKGIVLQPENVLITNEDFEGSMGPGNPLDAALRTIREYWRESDPVAAANAYPLLVVRPKGTSSYVLGRTAISSWDDEFGYELVDQDMKLAYPEKNPALADMIRRSIDDARQRQRALQRAMPAHPQGGGFVVSRSGGLVPLSGSAKPRGRYQPSGKGAGTGEGGDGVGAGRATQQYGERQDEATTETTENKNGGDPERQSAGRNTQGDAAQTSRSGSTNPLAESRGANWALPGGVGGIRGTGYTNPIRLTIAPNAIVLLPNNPRREVARPFVIGDDLTQTVDQLVNAVRQRIESWGVAPSGGYWQPELQLEIDPRAERLTQSVETLLQGSGLTLKRIRR